jgi:hypothetical protein
MKLLRFLPVLLLMPTVIGVVSVRAQTPDDPGGRLEAWGEREHARDHLTRAIVMFRDMGMAWDLERAEQTLREL